MVSASNVDVLINFLISNLISNGDEVMVPALTCIEFLCRVLSEPNVRQQNYSSNEAIDVINLRLPYRIAGSVKIKKFTHRFFQAPPGTFASASVVGVPGLDPGSRELFRRNRGTVDEL